MVSVSFHPFVCFIRHILKGIHQEVALMVCVVASVKQRTYLFFLLYSGWLGSRVVSLLDSGAVGPRFKSQS